MRRLCSREIRFGFVAYVEKNELRCPIALRNILCTGVFLYRTLHYFFLRTWSFCKESLKTKNITSGSIFQVCSSRIKCVTVALGGLECLQYMYSFFIPRLQSERFGWADCACASLQSREIRRLCRPRVPLYFAEKTLGLHRRCVERNGQREQSSKPPWTRQTSPKHRYERMYYSRFIKKENNFNGSEFFNTFKCARFDNSLMSVKRPPYRHLYLTLVRCTLESRVVLQWIMFFCLRQRLIGWVV